jgi:hypothetical protein
VRWKTRVNPSGTPENADLMVFSGVPEAYYLFPFIKGILDLISSFHGI